MIRNCYVAYLKKGFKGLTYGKIINTAEEELRRKVISFINESQPLLMKRNVWRAMKEQRIKRKESGIIITRRLERTQLKDCFRVIASIAESE